MNFFLSVDDLFVGRKIRAMFSTNPDSSIFDGVFLPLEIIAEYPNYFVCNVLPHRNPNRSWGISKPYRMTVNKFSVKVGEILVKSF